MLGVRLIKRKEESNILYFDQGMWKIYMLYDVLKFLNCENIESYSEHSVDNLFLLG